MIYFKGHTSASIVIFRRTQSPNLHCQSNRHTPLQQALLLNLSLLFWNRFFLHSSQFSWILEIKFNTLTAVILGNASKCWLCWSYEGFQLLLRNLPWHRPLPDERDQHVQLPHQASPPHVREGVHLQLQGALRHHLRRGDRHDQAAGGAGQRLLEHVLGLGRRGRRYVQQSASQWPWDYKVEEWRLLQDDQACFRGQKSWEAEASGNWKTKVKLQTHPLFMLHVRSWHCVACMLLRLLSVCSMIGFDTDNRLATLFIPLPFQIMTHFGVFHTNR